jgi:hypothetical protein
MVGKSIAYIKHLQAYGMYAMLLPTMFNNLF